MVDLGLGEWRDRNGIVTICKVGEEQGRYVGMRMEWLELISELKAGV